MSKIPISLKPLITVCGLQLKWLYKSVIHLPPSGFTILNLRSTGCRGYPWKIFHPSVLTVCHHTKSETWILRSL